MGTVAVGALGGARRVPIDDHRPARSVGPPLILCVVGGYICLSTMLPLAVIVREGLLASPRPTGFGQDLATLVHLVGTSIGVALLPAALAAVLAALASCISVIVPWFRRFYRVWIHTLLFTNPVFLVLGLSVLTSSTPPLASVMLATAFILLPLVALPIQAATDHVELSVLNAARALGSRRFRLVWHHLLPAIRAAVLFATLLATVFALGFYLLPTFIGYGHVATIGAAIDVAVNRLGDTAAAAQLGILILGMELLLVAAAGGAALAMRARSAA